MNGNIPGCPIRKGVGVTFMLLCVFAAVMESGCASPVGRAGGRRTFCTPVVSWQKDDEGGACAATPLLVARGGKKSGGWVFPLFAYAHDEETGITEGMILWGRYWKQGNRGSASLFPFYKYDYYGTPHEDEIGRYGSFLLLCLLYSSKKQVFVSPAGGGVTATTVVTERRLFPLWSYYSKMLPGNEGTRKSRFNLLWWLFRYEKTPLSGGGSRVGVSILWRLLRYQRGPGGCELDILFLPVAREKGDGQ